MVDVTQPPYNAKGDGISDDTAALQRAISELASVGSNRAKILYLPPGEFKVSRTLEWRTADGKNAAKLFIVGAGREKTTIRLVDEASGFGSPSAPRAVLYLRSEHNPAWYLHSPLGEELGEGHLAFYNGLFDLTIDTGTGNPGAIGVALHVSNMGGIGGVTIRSSDGQGVRALDMTRRNVGPGLVADVKLEGFDVGAEFGGLFSMVLIGIDCSGQRTAAIRNRGGVLNLDRLTTVGAATSVENLDSTGLVVLTRSRLADSGQGFQVRNHGAMLVADSCSGDAPISVLSEGTPVVTLPDSRFWSSSSVVAAERPTLAALPTPPDVPRAPILNEEEWANVADFGADPIDARDDTDSIQRALDSGKRGVFFPNWSGKEGRYLISRPLVVPRSVERIDGSLVNLFTMQSVEFGRAQHGGTEIFRVSGETSKPLFIERIIVRNSGELARKVRSVTHASSRPLVLRHFRFNSIGNAPGAGEMFLVDASAHNPICGQLVLDHPQKVWAWQLNLEDSEQTKIIARSGVQLVVFGLKTERPAGIVEAFGDARVFILGALHYQQHAAPKPAYLAYDSAEITASFATASSASVPGVRGYPILARAQSLSPHQSREVKAGAELSRGGDSELALVPLLTVVGPRKNSAASVDR